MPAHAVTNQGCKLSPLQNITYFYDNFVYVIGNVALHAADSEFNIILQGG